MLKDALRRLLWLGPTLLLVTLPTFWALARAQEHGSGSRTNALPLFFNSNPLGARERAVAAVTLIAQGGAEADDAARSLEKQGGAALPHVLSSLDALEPAARGRVALALSPIAERMGVGSPRELESTDAAAIFFNRYWQEHSVDFRPAVVHREVGRFSERPSDLRLSEVQELDTFALEDLIDGMRPMRDVGDVARARHLAVAAAHITETSWTIPPGASVEVARGVVERWEEFWLEHRSDYVTLTGTRRLAATLTETRYGRWLEHLSLRGRSFMDGDHHVGETLRERGMTTLYLVLVGLFFGYPAGLLMGVLASMRRHKATAVGVVSFAAAVATAGIVGVSGVFVGMAGGRPRVAALLSMVMVTGALGARHFRAVQIRTAELGHIRTERAFGAPATRITFRNLRLTSGFVTALAVADLPNLLTASFVAERAFSLRGLGEITVEAARSGDHTALMALALLGTFTLGVAQIAADLWLRICDPRIPGARSRAHGAGS